MVQAVRFLQGFATDRVIGHEIQINLTVGKLREAALASNPRCRLSHAVWDLEVLAESTHELTLGHLFDRAAKALDGDVRLQVYDDALVRASRCAGCGRLETTARLRQAHAQCPTCTGTLIPLAEQIHDYFGRDDVSDLLNAPWHEIGLPPAGAVIALGDKGQRTFLFQIHDSEV